MALGQVNKDRWERFKGKVKDAARMPIQALLVFTAGVVAWLGGWTVWRAGEWLFWKYLETPWIER